MMVLIKLKKLSFTRHAWQYLILNNITINICMRVRDPQARDRGFLAFKIKGIVQ
jgi:hypothetical protein